MASDVFATPLTVFQNDPLTTHAAVLAVAAGCVWRALRAAREGDVARKSGEITEIIAFFYYYVTTVTTVGCGAIAPKTAEGRLLAAL